MRKIGTGIYLVVDPSMQEAILLDKLRACLKENLAAVQIWDNFPEGADLGSIVNKIGQLCQENNTALLINNRWDLLKEHPLDGVHFDHIPENYDRIKSEINQPFLSGLTCNNDLAVIHWAHANQLDYISFCSLFPSRTSTSCELVDFNTIRMASQIANLPIFLAGGIRPDHVATLQELDYAGIAVISGVMDSARPEESVQAYQKQINKRKYENRDH